MSTRPPRKSDHSPHLAVHSPVSSGKLVKSVLIYRKMRVLEQKIPLLSFFVIQIIGPTLAKKNLSRKISSSSIDDIYNLAIKKGALGGKLLGAGGGGFFLLYVPHERQEKFMYYFKKFINETVVVIYFKT